MMIPFKKSTTDKKIDRKCMLKSNTNFSLLIILSKNTAGCSHFSVDDIAAAAVVDDDDDWGENFKQLQSLLYTYMHVKIHFN